MRFLRFILVGRPHKEHAQKYGYKILRAEFAHMLVIGAALKGWQSGPLGYFSLVHSTPISMLPFFTCPGLARSISWGKDMLLLGVLSASLDDVPASVSKSGKGTKQAASHNYARTEDHHQKSLHFLVKKLEFSGARVLLFFDGSTLGSPPEVLKEQRFKRQLYASQGFDGSSSSSSSTPK